jgi:hypothetical protein
MSMLYVVWEPSVLIGQLLALKEGIAVDWMTKQSSISFRQEKVFCHLQSIQTTSEASFSSYAVCAQDKVAGPGSKPLISV